jgi:chromosome segregation ATPase
MTAARPIDGVNPTHTPGVTADRIPPRFPKETQLQMAINTALFGPTFPLVISSVLFAAIYPLRERYGNGMAVAASCSGLFLQLFGPKGFSSYLSHPDLVRRRSFLKTDLQLLNNLINRISAENNPHSQKLENLRVKLVNLNETYPESIENIATIYAECMGLFLPILSDLLPHLEGRVAQLTLSNTGLQGQVAQLTLHTTGLQGQVAQLTLSNTDLQGQVAQLTLSNTDLQGQVDSFCASLQKETNRRMKLAKLLEATLRKKEELGTELDVTVAEIAQLKKAKEATLRQKTELDASLRKAREENAQLQQVNSHTQQELNSVRAKSYTQIENLERALLAKEAEIHRQTEARAAAEKRKEELENALSLARIEIDRLSQENHQTQNELSSVKKTVAVLQQNMGDARETMQRFHEELKELRSENLAAQAELNATKQQAKVLATDVSLYNLEDERAENKAVKENLEKVTQENAKLKADMLELSKRLDLLMQPGFLASMFGARK